MTMDKKASRIFQLSELLYNLSESQLGWIEAIVNQFKGVQDYRIVDSDLIDGCMLESFGDALLIHHCMSREPFSKDKFEYVLARVANFCGRNAQLAPKGNPGRDLTIDDITYSLKTQADRNIKVNEIHISKFMELGQGEWSNDPNQLIGLRTQFIQHMKSYERILTLRAISRGPFDWKYELVEIPKLLLLEALNGDLVMAIESRQNPKPGYCFVKDNNGNTKFQLYFDGGSERKLQIKHIQKNFCRVHATWKFSVGDLYTQSHLSSI